MGLLIRLEDESGKSLEDLPDWDNVLSRVLPWGDQSFHCLRYVDPYGNAIFNRLQMDELMQELKRIRGVAQTELEREFIDAVERLAQRCKDRLHLYLRFRGD